MIIYYDIITSGYLMYNNHIMFFKNYWSGIANHIVMIKYIVKYKSGHEKVQTFRYPFG